MWITLEQIHSLNQIKETGSINAASLSLNKAKSAISYSIKRLEEQLDFKVLDRSEYRISLTPKGEAFLTKALPLLEQSETLKAEVGKIALGIESKISLSATTIYPSTRLNSVMRELITKFPSTEFAFHQEVLSGERMLLNGDVDIAICESLDEPYNLEYKEISTVILKLVLCSNHPFLNLPKEQQILSELVKYPQIIIRSTIPSSTSYGVPRDSRKWTVSDLNSKHELISKNFGWGKLPGHLIEKQLQNKELTHLEHIDLDHPAKIYICKRKNKPFGPVLQYIWDSF